MATKKKSSNLKLAKLPARKQKYASELLKGKSKQQAKIAAGYSPKTVNRVIENEDFTSAMQELLDQEVDYRLAARRLNEALSATMVKTATHEGRITDEAQYTDHNTRITAAMKIMQLRGHKHAGGNVEGEGDGSKVVFIMNGKVVTPPKE